MYLVRSLPGNCMVLIHIGVGCRVTVQYRHRYWQYYVQYVA